MNGPMPAELLVSPLWQGLKDAQTVLIAGAGGGFDVYAGLPLFFALRDLGKQVHLANLTFTAMARTTARRWEGPLWQVDHHTRGETAYFPERYLAEWLAAHGHPSEVYALEKVGCVRCERRTNAWCPTSSRMRSSWWTGEPTS